MLTDPALCSAPTLRFLCMKRDTCVAEARAAGLNNLINDIRQFGLGTRTSLLGPVIQNRDYAPQPGGHDSGQVIQSALLVPRGLGVVVWDSEFYLSLVDVPDGLEAAAAMYHIPFEQCCPRGERCSASTSPHWWNDSSIGSCAHSVFHAWQDIRNLTRLTIGKCG